jgi:hypothetical protein
LSKTCSLCKISDSEEPFHKGAYRCKSCAKKVSKLWRESNPEKSRAKVKELFDKNREKYYNSHNDHQLFKKYGLTRDQYKHLLASTEGVCPICVRPFGTTAYTKPVVDHCHTSGKTRGIICRQCNIGLGAFRDNKISLAQAINYLTRSENE